MIITEVASNVAHPRIMWGTRKVIGFIAHIEHKLTLTRPDEITEKNNNKGYQPNFKYSNGLGITVLPSFVQLHGYFSRYVRLL